MACQSTNNQSGRPVDTLSYVVGNDRDSSGCISSAGYTWSAVRQDCIRVWEEGIRLMAANSSGSAQLSAFLVFGQDRKKVEIFMSENNLILSQVEEENYSNGQFDLKKDSAGWAVSFKDRILYQEM